jgi:lysophospholipase L1-like esterase
MAVMHRTIAALVAAVTVMVAAGCSSLTPEAAPSMPDSPLAAFYGDSYTLGTGASAESVRWSTVITGERGWREFNPSVNGLGFVNNRRDFGPTGDLPGLIIAEKPDVVFITMGLNDNFSYDYFPTKIRDQITTDFDRLSEALPDALFIVVEPFWYTDERPPSVDIISGWVRDAAATIDAEYIPGASHWLEGHPEWMAADGLHPNDEGYAEMARRMDEGLDALGLGLDDDLPLTVG